MDIITILVTSFKIIGKFVATNAIRKIGRVRTKKTEAYREPTADNFIAR